MKYISVMLMPWKWEGLVCVGGSPDDFKRYAKTMIEADIQTGSNSAGHAYVEYGKPFLLWVESLKNIPALAHEALHVTCGILEARGLKHHDASEEAYTYTMEDILRQTLDAKPSKWVAAFPKNRVLKQGEMPKKRARA